MNRFARYLCLQICVGIAFICFPARAQTPPPLSLNLLPSGGDLAGRPPELFAPLRNGTYAVVDPLDARIAIFDRAGAILGKSAPLSFFPATVRVTTETLEYRNADGSRYAILQRGVTPTTVGSLDEFSGSFAPPVSNVKLSRKSAQQITMRIAGRKPVTLTVRASLGGYLSNVKLLGEDGKGQVYVQTSEIVDMRPAIAVRVFVERFARDGALLGRASVPIEEMDSVPSEFAALTRAGDVDVLIPKRTGLFLQSLSFQPAGKKVSPASASPALQIPIAVSIIENPAGGIDDQGVQQAPPVIKPTSRAEIVKRARDYLELSWMMTPQNFSQAGIDNVCAKNERKYWLRPRRLTEELIGKKISFMPYRWGGDDTPESFKTKIAGGALAGSVCTCREAEFNYCQVRNTAGVDCSGFVSSSWGIPKYGTANLDRVATPITNFSKLRPGDALNKAGSHVRLFVGMKPGPDLRVEVIESTTNLRCEGVCKSVYSVEELSGYKALRFSGVSD
jgi:hypothetical protein